jgi:hypothetical protein
MSRVLKKSVSVDSLTSLSLSLNRGLKLQACCKN